MRLAWLKSCLRYSLGGGKKCFVHEMMYERLIIFLFVDDADARRVAHGIG